MPDTGIDFVYENGDSGDFHLAETLGGGVTAADFDRDGAADLVFVNGGNAITWPTATENRIAVYRSRGAAKFRNVTRRTRCHWSGYGHGCAAGDFNNDGFDDLYFTGYESAHLLLNLGDGTYLDQTVTAGVDTDRWAATATWGDLDNDGDLDLYVTAYCAVPRALPTPYCESRGVRIHCHPHHFQPVPDLVFENLGDGTFADRSATSGVADEAQYGLGAIMADLDHDGHVEVFVANDGDRNLLWSRQGEWTYQDVALTSGVAYSSDGQAMGSMGIGCADWDGNGLLDLVTTNFIHERNLVFLNQDRLVFFDRSANGAMESLSRPMVGWAAVPLDADNDGWCDLFIANGHVTDMPEVPYAQEPLLFRGSPTGIVSTHGGTYFDERWHGRGAVATDLTGDGRLDLVVSHIHAPAAVLRNVSTAGHRLRLQLIGSTSNRSAAGAWLRLTLGDTQLTRHVMLSGGYLGGSTGPLQIGIGPAEHVDSLDIHWPSGQIQRIPNLPSGATTCIIEGDDRPLRLPAHGSPRVPFVDDD